MMEKQNFMREKPVLPLLISMAVPMMISMLIQSLYNIVDGIFVAQIGEKAMTAVSLVYPLQNLVLSVGVGFGVGISSAIAINLGAGNQKAASEAASQGVLFSVIHGLLFILLGAFGAKPFLQMFTSDPEVLEMGCTYAWIVLSFSVVVTVQIAMEKICQAMGKMISTMLFMAAGSVVNIILDPIMIFGLLGFPAMGVAGAAVATVIGQICSLSLYFIAYFRGKFGLKLSTTAMRPQRDMVQWLYMVGLPATLSIALPSLMISILNGILAAWSEVYIVVLGIYFKMQSFIYLPASGIVQGMRPIISYNYGAGEKARLRQVLRWSNILTGSIMLLGTLLFLLFPQVILSIFNASPATMEAGIPALRIICLGFLVSTISVITSGALEALGQGGSSLLLSLARYLLVIAPAAWIGSLLLGPTGVWIAFPLAEGITALLSVFLLRKLDCLR